jgi:hypothetical protein
MRAQLSTTMAMASSSDLNTSICTCLLGLAFLVGLRRRFLEVGQACGIGHMGASFLLSAFGINMCAILWYSQ